LIQSTIVRVNIFFREKEEIMCIERRKFEEMSMRKKRSFEAVSMRKKRTEV
jgi:hypothetical protein